mgnify:CR=1 FL=1
MSDEEKGPKTGHYILKQGARHSHILFGEPVEFVGDGKGTIELNHDQAAAFKDKLIGESKEAVAFEPPAPVFDEVAGTDEVVADVVEVKDDKPAPAKK